VYLLPVASVAVTHVVPLVFLTSAYPVGPLTPSTAAWNVSVRAHFSAPRGAVGTFAVTTSWGARASAPLVLPAGESNATLWLSVTDVDLWWPVGYGAQALYEVSATFTPGAAGAPTVAAAPRRIGFRYAAAVTYNDTDPAAVAAATTGDGTDSNGLFFRVNGVAVWARGANMIPIDEFEGRYSAVVLARVVESARDGGMNMLRVWGGGVFLPAAFYDSCDEMGIMVYHDMQFAQDGHSPLDGSVAQAAEFAHQVRRLAAHPSIVIFDGCNECHVILGTPTGVYATFVLAAVEAEDTSRAIWPSCPAAGWKSGVRTLDSHPNGSPLGLNPQARRPTIARAELGTAAALDARGVMTTTLCAGGNCTIAAGFDVDGDGYMNVTADTDACCALCTSIASCVGAVWVAQTTQCWIKTDGTPVPKAERSLITPVGRAPKVPIETHGPYQHGGGFPAVNGDATLIPFASLIPLALSPTVAEVVTGVGSRNTFASEFGSSVFSSFESMAPTLAPEHWGVHGGAPPDSCGGGFERVCSGNNSWAQRNYPCDNIIEVYFGALDFDAVGEAPLKEQLWKCMLGQSLLMKGVIELRRSLNQFGHLIWQLNE
jgi:beta-mannosidase